MHGRVVVAHLDWGRQRLGQVAWARLHEGLPSALARWLDAGIDPHAWYPFADCVALDRAIAAALPEPPRQSWRAMGRHSASMNLLMDGAPHIADPHEVLRRDTMLQGNWVDFGHARYQPLGPNGGRIDLVEWSCYADAFCVSAEGFFERAIGIYGAAGPRVTQSACLCRGDETCRFEIEWE